MEDTLKQILKELVSDFNLKRNVFLSSSKLRIAFRTGHFALKGSKKEGYETGVGICFHFNVLSQFLGQLLEGCESSKKLVNYVIKNKLWHTEYSSFESSLQVIPSILDSIGGGFLARNFELNNYQFLINDLSFSIAYQELSNFFENNKVRYETYIHLKGVTGEVSELQLTDNVFIVQAGFELAKLFSINYSGVAINSEVFHDDYYMLKIKIETPKEFYGMKNFSKRILHELSNIEKWNALPILGLPGYLKMGKKIIKSSDWPIININAPGPYGEDDFHNSNLNKTFSLNDDSIIYLRNAANTIEGITTAKELHKKIQYSIERLAKSKSAQNIDDRVVDLSIAFEYLINTTKNDVLMQLRLKAIKLVYENNYDESIYKSISDFYELRSSIIHGNDKIKITDKNIALIEFMERFVQLATLRLLELTKLYKYEDIDKSLLKSLHVSKSLADLLLEIPN